jgi:hypothetical protein
MHPFIDVLFFTIFFVVALFLMAYGLITVAELFVDERISRHERRHHRNDCAHTTPAERK